MWLQMLESRGILYFAEELCDLWCARRAEGPQNSARTILLPVLVKNPVFILLYIC